MSFFALQFGLSGLFVLLDSIVYWLIAKIFSLFEVLAGTEIIQSYFFEQILDRVYVIIGIFMLFVVAYSLLKSLIDPDSISKGASKIAVNIVISLLLLGVVPTIFSYARTLQNIILKENVIGNILFSNNENGSNMKSSSMAFSFLTQFLEIPDNVIGDSKILNHSYTMDCGGTTCTWGDLKKAVDTGAEGNILKIGFWAEAIKEEKGEDNSGNVVEGISYIPIISTVSGVFLCYILMSFCIDLGIRVVKLAFYQLIAPVPILLRIIPEKKSVFDNWVKGSIATYMEVFSRLFIMYLVIWISSAIFTGNVFTNNLGSIGKIIVVMGIFAFAKQAPKLLADVTGIDSGNIKLGIGGKLAAGGALGAAAVMGGLAHSGLQGFTKGISNVAGADGAWNKAKALAGILPGAMMAGVGGGVRSVKGGFGAKTFGEAMKASDAATRKTMEARAKAQAYRAGHGGVLGSAYGHVTDTIRSAGAWAGVDNIIQKVDFEDKFVSAFDDYKKIYESGEYAAITEQINKFKAAKASGADAKDYGISDFDTAIGNLQSTQKKLRMDALQKKNDKGEYIYKDMAAYMVYNLSNLIQTNPSYAKELGLDGHISQEMAKGITLQNNKIYSGGKEMDISDIVDIIEKSGADGKGVFADRSTADTARKADVSTVAYKEYKKALEEAKKK